MLSSLIENVVGPAFVKNLVKQSESKNSSISSFKSLENPP